VITAPKETQAGLARAHGTSIRVGRLTLVFGYRLPVRMKQQVIHLGPAETEADAISCCNQQLHSSMRPAHSKKRSGTY
jgi:hypothetical protein